MALSALRQSGETLKWMPVGVLQIIIDYSRSHILHRFGHGVCNVNRRGHWTKPDHKCVTATNRSSSLILEEKTLLPQVGPLTEMPSSLNYFSAVSTGSDILITGGSSDGKSTNTVHRFNKESNVWSELRPMGTQRCHHSSACDIGNGLVYVTGGFSDTALRTCEVYNPVKNVWSKMQPMPCAVTFHSSVFYNGYLYVTGGLKDDRDSTSSCVIFYPKRNQWSRGSSLLRSRACHASTVMGTDILIAGGYCSTSTQIGNVIEDTLHHYDTITTKWSTMEDWQLPRLLSQCHLLQVSLEGDVIVIGGHWKEDSTFCFRRKRGGHSWETITIGDKDTGGVWVG